MTILHMTTVQTFAMYAMLPDEYVTESPHYPYISAESMIESVFTKSYDSDLKRYVNVSPVPLTNSMTSPIHPITLSPNNCEICLGRRQPNKKYPNGKTLWVNTSRWHNDQRQESGWYESFVWFNSRHMPLVHDYGYVGQWTTYQGHPLQTRQWRLMLPSEMRVFLGVDEKEWETWAAQHINS